jgi:hypothetical protein
VSGDIDARQLIVFELGWQRRLLSALLQAEPLPLHAIEVTKRRVDALTQAIDTQARTRTAQQVLGREPT